MNDNIFIQNRVLNEIRNFCYEQLESVVIEDFEMENYFNRGFETAINVILDYLDEYQ